MNRLKIFLMTFVAVVVASCGGSDSSIVEVSVDNTSIGGRLSQYFSLEDKTYKYEKGIVDHVTVELKCIEPLPENLKAYIGVDVLDADGTVISAGKPDAWSFSDYDVLRQASAGQIVTIQVDNHQNVPEGETPAKIRLSSVVEEDVKTETSDSSVAENGGDDSDDGEVSSSEDWDALLDSYDSYVTKYISFLKKAANGDVTAMTEYPALLEKAQEFSSKMQNAQGDMTASQWARYNEITMKMANAAQNL